MKFRIKLTLVTFVLLIGMVFNSYSQNPLPPYPKKSDPPEKWQEYRRQQKQLRKMLLGDHDWRKEGIHNGNQVSTVFYNYGTIGQPGNRASLVWPKGIGFDYGYEFGVLIAAEVYDTTGLRRHIISEGLDYGGDTSPSGLPWGFEPLPGYARYDQPYIAMSDDKSTWPKSWPNRPSAWDGHWIAEYGLDAETADQESYYVMDDAENKEFAFFPDPINDPDRGGLGVEIEARGYQWHQTLAQDCIFFIYIVKNVGADTLNKVYLGMYGDPHIGGTSDYDDDIGAWDTKYDMVYAWDKDFRGRPNPWRPGYLGYKYLESPGEPYDNIDNDEDGIVDESMQDNIDNDGDWNPVTDDVGADGIDADANRNGIQDGNEQWDYGERDGIPTHGEPNFDETDLDEADQIGLTSFAVYEWASLTPSQDEATWTKMVAGVFDTTDLSTPKDNVLQYASGPIKMAPGDKRRFSITLFFGYDVDDLFRSAATVQRIYNEGYRFTRAPEKPKVTAVAGDGKVTLYWDSFAEQSRDPILGYDFEGYNIYRGTDHGLSDAYVITDAQGNPTLYKPIAQFNVPGDGWYGPHPVETENGVHFFMGKDDTSALRHSWTDTTVVNGQTYYYAVVSFDHGDSINIPPTECAWEFDEFPPFSGNYLPTVNTAIVTPQAPAAGYVPPSIENGNVDHIGPATGKIDISFLDPDKVKDNHIYKISFDDTTSEEIKTFSLWDASVVVAELVPVTIRYQYTDWDTTVIPPMPIDSVRWTTLDLSHANIIDNEYFEIYNADSSYLFPKDTSLYELDWQKGWVYIKDTEQMPIDQVYYVKYQYYLIANSPHIDGEDQNPFIDGFRIIVKDDPLAIDYKQTGFIKGNSNYNVIVTKYPNQGVEVPYDYWIVLTDTVSSISYNNKPCKFYVLNMTDSTEAEFVFQDSDKDSAISDNDIIFPIIKVNNRARGTWQARFMAPRDSIVLVDSLNADGYPVYDKEGEKIKIPIDTIYVAKIPPKAGDVFQIHTKKPFTHKDVYSFKTKRSYVEPQRARKMLDKIAVVPNPYVAASEFEKKPNLISGRGDRLIYFIHLPAKCTIRIYTLTGELVKTLHHDSPYEDGSEAWNLLSKDSMDIAYGIYIYHVDAPGVGEYIDKFAVIK